jgi:type I restriction enzyme, S subunit
MTRVLSLRRIAQNTVAKDLPGVRPLINLDTVESGTGRLIPGASPAVAVADQNLAAGPGVVLFAKLRPYLRKSFIPSGPVFVSSEFLCLTPLGGIDPRWLMWSTLSDVWVEHAVASTYGSKMPRTSWEEMSTLRLSVPVEGQQRRIADFLDDQVARIDSVLALRAAQVQAIIERSRVTIEELLQAPTLVPLRRLVADVCVGIVVQPAALYVWDNAPGVPALRGTDVKPGRIVTASPVRISRAGHVANPRSQLRAGDVVIVRTGAAGAAAVIGSEAEGWNCIDLVIVRPGLQLSANFLELVLNDLAERDRIGAASSGSIQAHFGVGAVKALNIPVLPIEQQRIVATRAGEARASRGEVLAAVTESRRLLQERKAALITAAVTGEFDVTTAGPRAAAAVTG